MIEGKMFSFSFGGKSQTGLKSAIQQRDIAKIEALLSDEKIRVTINHDIIKSLSDLRDIRVIRAFLSYPDLHSKAHLAQNALLKTLVQIARNDADIALLKNLLSLEEVRNAIDDSDLKFMGAYTSYKHAVALEFLSHPDLIKKSALNSNSLLLAAIYDNDQEIIDKLLAIKEVRENITPNFLYLVWNIMKESYYNQSIPRKLFALPEVQNIASSNNNALFSLAVEFKDFELAKQLLANKKVLESIQIADSELRTPAMLIHSGESIADITELIAKGKMTAENYKLLEANVTNQLDKVLQEAVTVGDEADEKTDALKALLQTYSAVLNGMNTEQFEKLIIRGIDSHTIENTKLLLQTDRILSWPTIHTLLEKSPDSIRKLLIEKIKTDAQKDWGFSLDYENFNQIQKIFLSYLKEKKISEAKLFLEYFEKIYTKDQVQLILLLQAFGKALSPDIKEIAEYMLSLSAYKDIYLHLQGKDLNNFITFMGDKNSPTGLLKLLETNNEIDMVDSEGRTPQLRRQQGEASHLIVENIAKGVFNTVTNHLNNGTMTEAIMRWHLSKPKNREGPAVQSLVADCLKVIQDQHYPEVYREKIHQILYNIVLSEHTIDEMIDLFKAIDASPLQTIAARTYPEFLKTMSKFIYVPTNEKEVNNEKLNTINTVYNNDQYIKEDPTSTSSHTFTKGQPLLTTTGVPLGYNIHLPEGEIKGVMVRVYGGHQKSDISSAFKPNVLSNLEGFLLNHQIAVITLNTSNLLKLDVFQAEMSNELYDEIQASIHEFYEILKQHPEKIDSKLTVISDKPIILRGESWGGSVAVRHAQMYPHTFDGYISHDGNLSAEMERKSNLPQIHRAGLTAHFNPAEVSEMKKISEPILGLHNRDDNNLNVKVLLDFYEKMQQLGMSDLVRIYIAQAGNPMPKDKPVNKGHFITTGKEDFRVYAETVRSFVEHGLTALPQISEWRAYKQAQLANQFYMQATPLQKFIAHANELYAAKKYKTPQRDVNVLWDSEYKPLFYAVTFANQLAHDSQALDEEIERLKQGEFLTDEVIRNTLLAQKNIFLQYLKEHYDLDTSEEGIEAESLLNVNIIQQFRNEFSYLRGRDNKYIEYFLTSLYKSNPALLKPLYPEFEQDPNLQSSLIEAKRELQKSFEQQRKMIFSTWKAAAKEAVKSKKPTHRLDK